MRHYQALMKHSFSSLPDLPFQAMVDDAQKTATISVPHFDSELIAEIVTRVLPREMSVVAYRDDYEGAMQAPPPYALTLKVGDVEMKTQAVILMSLNESTNRVSLMFRPA